MLTSLAGRSLANRKNSVLLTFLALLVSISLVLSVEHIRKQAKTSFGRTVSGVDLIVGGRSGQLNLLLSSVFRVGTSNQAMSWESFETLSKHRQVTWAVPMSLGDSHRGYRVLGTNQDYFSHFKYGDKRPLSLSAGKVFDGVFEAVLGAEVARELGYEVGETFFISHGVGQVSFSHHDAAPFAVAGILAPTGTPVDKAIHVTMEGLEAAHMSPARLEDVKAKVAAGETVTIEPKILSAVMLGLKSRLAVLQMQRAINEFKQEPLSAILPGVALAELWQMLGTLENVLLIIGVMIMLSSLLGLATMLLASMRERQREMAVLRAIGAGPGAIFMLIQVEAVMIAMAASAASLGVVSFALWAGSDWLANRYGLFITPHVFTLDSLYVVIAVLLATLLVSVVPAVSAYRTALHQGLNSGR